MSDTVRTEDLRKKMLEVWGSRGLSMLDDALQAMPARQFPRYIGTDKDGDQVWELSNGRWWPGKESAMQMQADVDNSDSLMQGSNGLTPEQYQIEYGPVTREAEVTKA